VTSTVRNPIQNNQSPVQVIAPPTIATLPPLPSWAAHISVEGPYLDATSEDVGGPITVDGELPGMQDELKVNLRITEEMRADRTVTRTSPVVEVHAGWALQLDAAQAGTLRENLSLALSLLEGKQPDEDKREARHEPVARPNNAPEVPDRTTSQRLVPLPVSDHYARGYTAHVGGRTGQPDPNDPSDTIEVWGHCRPFCSATEGIRTDGLTVGEHGPFCQSQMTAGIDGRDMAGERASIYATVVQAYQHGTYLRADLYGRHFEPEVQLDLVLRGIEPDEGDSDARKVNISIGDARRLAAGLIRAAEVADRLDIDLQDAKRARAENR